MKPDTVGEKNTHDLFLGSVWEHSQPPSSSNNSSNSSKKSSSNGPAAGGLLLLFLLLLLLLLLLLQLVLLPLSRPRSKKCLHLERSRVSFLMKRFLMKGEGV